MSEPPRPHEIRIAERVRGLGFVPCPIAEARWRSATPGLLLRRVVGSDLDHTLELLQGVDQLLGVPPALGVHRHGNDLTVVVQPFDLDVGDHVTELSRFGEDISKYTLAVSVADLERR
jgi:hypothetical protein